MKIGIYLSGLNNVLKFERLMRWRYDWSVKYIKI